MPERYKGKQGRIIVKASWNPVDLIYRATLPTTLAILIVGVILIIIILSIALIFRRRKTKK
jgi:subtilase family serine protease